MPHNIGLRSQNPPLLLIAVHLFMLYFYLFIFINENSCCNIMVTLKKSKVLIILGGNKRNQLSFFSVTKDPVRPFNKKDPVSSTIPPSKVIKTNCGVLPLLKVKEHHKPGGGWLENFDKDRLILVLSFSTCKWLWWIRRCWSSLIKFDV